MENYVPMTTADGAMFASVTSQTMAVILAAELTVIFGYLAGLHFFIHRARMPLRVFAHVLLLLALGYFWLSFAFQFGLNYFVGSSMEMSLSMGVMMNTEDDFAAKARTFMPLFEWIMYGIQFFVVIGVTYLAFFFDWHLPEKSK